MGTPLLQLPPPAEDQVVEATVTITVLEVAGVQRPLDTTARIYFVAVNVPICAGVNVVVLVPILERPTVKLALSALCHWIVPVALAIVILLSGTFPLQIAWLIEVKPTVGVGLTSNKTTAELLVHKLEALTTHLKLKLL